MHFSFLLFFFSAFFSCVTFANITLTSPSGISELRRDYIYSILTAALKSSDNDAVEVISIPTKDGYSANSYAVKKGEVDVTYFPTNIDIEQQLIPIRIPLYKGLMGYRTLLIKKKQQEKFNFISTVEDLKKLMKGTGSRWRTTKVLEHHEFNYITATRTSSLFKMLSLGRFDYTSRGVIETLEVLNSIKNKYTDIKIEDHLLLYTPLPVYFFVSKDKPQLAERISTGLVNISTNGTFDKIFNQFYDVILASIKLENKTVFYLDNPFLSVESKVNTENYWLHQMNKPAF